MAAETSKGKSPFNPGQPVPVELFTGREEQINRILTRGVAQVAAGKPMSFYIQGEYGIGKTSIARFSQWVADMDHGLHSIYATLGACKNLNDVLQAVLIATLRSGAFNPNRSEKIRNWLAKYIGKQELFNINFNFDALRKDAPNMANPENMIEFLTEVTARLSDTGIKGIFLVFDEINGLTSDPAFARFLKGFLEVNAMQEKSVQLLFMICGVEERRREMIGSYQPIERIFEIVEINAMTDSEMKMFFEKAFNSVGMSVNRDAVEFMSHYSAGFPKIMHLVGDAAYWRDDDAIVDIKDATSAVIVAAEDVGQKFVEQQVYRALQSKDYLAILAKIAKMGPNIMSFTKAEVASGLTDAQKKKFGNFLDRMKNLKVLSSGLSKGEYVFNSRMVRLYIWLKQLQEESNGKRNRSSKAKT